MLVPMAAFTPLQAQISNRDYTMVSGQPTTMPVLSPKCQQGVNLSRIMQAWRVSRAGHGIRTCGVEGCGPARAEYFLVGGRNGKDDGRKG